MAIHSLRPEFRPDNSRNQVRANQTARAPALSVQLERGAFGWSICSSAPSPFSMPSGLVVQESEIIAPPFDAQVLSFAARPGQNVAAGQQLGNVVSTQMLDLISSLITRNAQIEVAPKPDRHEAAAIAVTLPEAEKRDRTARAARTTIEKAVAGGYSTRVRQAETTRDTYDAAREVESLRDGRASARRRKRRQQIESGKYRGRAGTGAGDLSRRRHVEPGPERSARGSPTPGAVLSHGEVMAEVFPGEKYVLAYLPTNRMYASSRRARR